MEALMEILKDDVPWVRMTADNLLKDLWWVQKMEAL